jgi:hypothetical protein
MQQGRRREVERVVGLVSAGLPMQLLLMLTQILKSQHPGIVTMNKRQTVPHVKRY